MSERPSRRRVVGGPADPVRIGPAVATFVPFVRDVDAAYLIVGGSLLDAGAFFLV